MLTTILWSGCAKKNNEKVAEFPKEYQVISVYPSGKAREQNVFVTRDGKKEVYGFQELHENGQVKMAGRFDANGQRTGLWESFYQDGKPWSIGEYENSIEIGEKKTWYPNGNLRYQGQMKNGKPHGKWTFYDEAGNTTTKEY